jgi:hypothetical protein
MLSFCFSCGTPCKTQKGLENHVKSCPKCLHDIGIACADSLGLSPSSPLTQLINHHSFRFETNPNLASKRSVEVMWQDENSLVSASSLPKESPSKSRKGSSASSILRSANNSSLLVEHRCGTKKIDMIFDDNEAIRPLPDLLIDKLPAEESSAPALSLFQIRHIQSLLASTSEEFSSDDDSSISGDGLACLDAPPFVDADLPNNDYDVGQEERMFEQAKMYADRGNGCFTNEEILSNPLLGIMRDIGAPLETYRRIVALFQACDYGSRTNYNPLPSTLQHY